MIERIVPPTVAVVAAFGDDAGAALFPDEAEQIAGAVPSRLREFTTGRACARDALRKLGLPAVPIPRGPNRQPVWPCGIVGSITHCVGYRAAGVARRRDVLTIGIDAEVDEPLPSGVLAHVALAEESAWLAAAPSGVRWDRLLFSAKESVFKAWYPLARCWLGFDQAVVTFDPDSSTFDVRLLAPAPPALASGQLRGRFLVRDGLVATAIVAT